MRARAFAVAVSLAAFGFVCGARADEGGARVLVLRDPDTSRLVGKIRGDLEGRGFVVVEEPAPEAEPTRASLEDAAHRAGALAALRVRPSRGGVDVWIADRLTGKLVLKEAVLSGVEGSDERVVAIRTVELLRASLLEVNDPPPAAVVAPAPPAVTKLVARPPERAARWEGRVGAGVGIHPGGVPLTANVALGASVFLGSRLAVGATLVVPVAPVRVADRTGEASVSAGFASLDPAYRVALGSGATEIAVGPTAGLAWVRIAGAGQDGFKGLATDELLATVGGSARVERRLGGGLLAFVEIRGATAAPRLALRFDGIERATFGQALFLGLLGVGYGR